MNDLITKYRPFHFDEICEQESIKKVLIKHIESDKPNPVYIFCGIRGCGKHTVAQILSNGLNRNDKLVTEFSAEGLTLEEVQAFAELPVERRYNVCVINKSHLLSDDISQFLLEHYKDKHSKSIFILITTKPGELNDELGSKILKLNFGRIKEEHIIDVLKDIASKESFTNIDGVSTYIAFNCHGSLGEAIKLLQGCAEYDTELQVENITKIIDGYSYEELFSLMSWVVDGEEARITKFVDDAYDDNRNLEKLIDQLLRFSIDINLYLICGTIDVTPFPKEFEGMLVHIVTMKNPKGYFSFLNEEIIKLKFWVKGIEDIRFYVTSRLLKLSRVNK